MQKKLEILTNVSIAILCLTVSGLLIKRLLLTPPTPEPTPAVAKGAILDLPRTLEVGDAEAVVVMALAPGCGYCNESMTFYRTLTTQPSTEATKLRFVAAVRDANQVEDERQVLHAAGVEVDQVVVTDFHDLGVPGTPMLIVANQRGEVLGAWLGKLDEEREQEVLETLRQGIPSYDQVSSSAGLPARL